MVRHDNNHGFTLIEIAIAMTITAIITGFIYTSFSATLDSKQRVEEMAELYHTGRVFMLRLSTELQDAYLQPEFYSYTEEIDQPRSTVFYGEDRTDFGRDYDVLTFTSLSHMTFPYDAEDNNQSSHTQITYDVKTDYDSDDGAILRVEDPTLDKDVETMVGQGVSYILAENVRSINYRYYDKKRDVWEDNWDTLQMNPPQLPSAVEIRLVLGMPMEYAQDPDDVRELVFTSMVYLPMSEKTPITLQDEDKTDTGKWDPSKDSNFRDRYHRTLPVGGRPARSPRQ